MYWFFGRWRFLSNGNYNFIGLALILGLGLFTFGLLRGLIGDLILNNCYIFSVVFLFCLCVHR